jgi:hypothetical protein
VKGEDGIRTEIPAKRGVRLINRDVAAFAFFLFLSFILWYLNSLGKEAETGISYPVKYTNLPKDRLITEKSPEELNLFLKGPGYSILKLKLSGNKSPLLIDISKINYRKVPGGKPLNYYIITSGLSKSLNIQMRSGCEITSIKPDTIFFSFDRQSSNSSAVIDNRSESRKLR